MDNQVDLLNKYWEYRILEHKIYDVKLNDNALGPRTVYSIICKTKNLYCSFGNWEVCQTSHKEVADILIKLLQDAQNENRS